ncbi:MAG: VacJ family lipoprotein [Polaromonas sp.]|nr:VacJ family lipoprotein [Polaromonas sp.]
MTHIPTLALGASKWLGLATFLVLQGCASAPNANPADPLEPFNRGVFELNDKIDRAVVKPVASAYREITPKPIRTGVTNFFANLADAWSAVNNTLQLKGEAATNSLFRFTTNTLWGLGGFLDVASEMRIPRHTEDFGQTLGYWGVPAGPYLVLPVLGPSTVRDTVGTFVDFGGNLATRGDNVGFRNSMSSIGIVNARASLLDAGDLLEQVSLDKYSFARDVYLQRRRALVSPSTSEKEERFDLPEEPAPDKAETTPGAAPVPAK